MNQINLQPWRDKATITLEETPQLLKDCATRMQEATRQINHPLRPLTYEVIELVKRVDAPLFSKALARWEGQAVTATISTFTHPFVIFSSIVMLSMSLYVSYEAKVPLPVTAYVVTIGQFAPAMIALGRHLQQRDAVRQLHHWAGQMTAITNGQTTLQQPPAALIWVRAVNGAEQVGQVTASLGPLIVCIWQIYEWGPTIVDNLIKFFTPGGARIQLAPHLENIWQGAE
jgi:hypothetical protein